MYGGKKGRRTVDSAGVERVGMGSVAGGGQRRGAGSGTDVSSGCESGFVGGSGEGAGGVWRQPVRTL